MEKVTAIDTDNRNKLLIQAVINQILFDIAKFTARESAPSDNIIGYETCKEEIIDYLNEIII